MVGSTQINIYSINDITIYNVGSMDLPTPIEIVLRLRNSDIPGLSNPFIISTYSDYLLTQLIDEDSTSCQITVVTNSSPELSGIIASNN